MIDQIFEPNLAALLLVVALMAAPVTAVVGMWRVAWAAPVAAATAALGFGLTLWSVAAGGSRFDVAWAPTWNLCLSFELDGLARLYALLATGIGFLVVVYSARYIPLHLHHQSRPTSDAVRFYGLILLFMGSMVGLVMAQDLILIFVFWDLTAIASYFLIGYDRQTNESRSAALMAFLLTGVSAVFFLIGALMLYAKHATFALPELIGLVEPGPYLTTAAALMVIAALAKSAQVPLHIWLPRAMAAPTPVSAYLHSAAMVAAGVFLLGRIYPLIVFDERILNGLLLIGLLSMAIGGVLALTRDVLKQILAYSTVSQYGYVVVMLGLGGAYGVAGASFYVIAHALAKCALFLTAGAITEATGEKQLSRLGSLRHAMPGLAVASGIAAAGLAAFPLAIGFFKDELFFAAALERGWGFAALAVLGAALTLAYIGRFWIGLFLGPAPAAPRARPLPKLIVAPITLLAALTLAGGVFPRPFARLAEEAAAVTFGAPAPIQVSYHLDARAENLLALATYALGAFLLVARPHWRTAAFAVTHLGERIGPSRWYALTLDSLNRLSDSIHRYEVRDLRSRVATILAPAGILVGLGVVFSPVGGAFVVGSIDSGDWPLILILLVTVVAAVATTLPRDHLALALVLSSVGFSLAVVYAFVGAPDVALVAVLIETIFTLLFLGVLALLPRHVLRHETFRQAPASRRWRDPLLATIAGGMALAVAWSAFSKPASQESVIVAQAQLTPEAHASNIVTAILADFRGLDTMGEITVVGIALLGIVVLFQAGRFR